MRRIGGMVEAVTAVLAALAAFCPAHMDLAPIFKAAERRYFVHAARLVSHGSLESYGCRPHVVNRRTGAVGVMQILPRGSANPGKLTTEQLKDPRTNIMLGARHLARLHVLCGTWVAAGAVYHGRKKCRADDHARAAERRFRAAFR